MNQTIDNLRDANLPDPRDLPDVSATERPQTAAPLSWVGMQAVDLPVQVSEGVYQRELHARADIYVDLPAPDAKGIHMSRLYHHLDALSDYDSLSPDAIRRQLEQIIDSHADCASTAAKLILNFKLLVKRKALVSPAAGFKSYPVRIEASLSKSGFGCRHQVSVTYSSTCPCSAALARQLVQERFYQQFADQSMIELATASNWIGRFATFAAPHAQRSVAKVSIASEPEAVNFELLKLIDQVEGALGTPVQTYVKRADEQAFAALNGQNPMFVEDAARQIKAVLGKPDAEIRVRHFESLHQHDAAAQC